LSDVPAAGAARTQLSTDGFAVLRKVISGAWLRRLAEALDEALARPSPLGQQLARTGGGAFFSDLYLSASFPAFRAFATDSGIGARVAAATGLTRVVLFTDELLVKEQHTAAITPWHHDAVYWPLLGEQVFSAWIPLDPVEAERGALEFVRGSHAWPRTFRPTDFASGLERVTHPDEESMPDVEAITAPDDRIVADAEPGDCVLFHGRTLHRASGNPSRDLRRRAIVLRVVGPDVAFDPRPGTLPIIWAPRLAPGQPLGHDPVLFPTLYTGVAAAS